MKAVIYNKKHSPYPLDLKEVDKPIPKDDEVLIGFVAVSLNPVDSLDQAAEAMDDLGKGHSSGKVIIYL